MTKLKRILRKWPYADRFHHLAILGVSLVLLAGCAGQPPVTGPCTIAVWELEDLSTARSAMSDVGSLLTSRIMDTLGRSGHCRIVERQKLLLALEELNLGSSSLADEGTRLRIGRIVGANQMVFGAYQIIGPVVRMDLRLVDVASGRVLQTATESSPSTDIAQWMAAAEQAAKGLIKP